MAIVVEQQHSRGMTMSTYELLGEGLILGI